ncbi:MAG: beta-carotene 3-hydroxylase [Crocinitomicaceae bacterium]|jgi:beta-carotene 3-hydroxylase
MIFGIGFLAAFMLMELCAWLAHKYIMHGFLWSIHEDHHQPTGSAFQKNDLFFLIFAIPSWLSIMFGMMKGVHGLTGIGFGIAAYGVAYFLVHDILIHRRFNWFDKVQNRYFNAVRRAHRVHHEKRFKEDGESFGMLYIPRKFYKE